MAALILTILPTIAAAGELHVQFNGKLPEGNFQIAYKLQKVLVDGCSSPCDVSDWKRALVRRHSNGIGLLALDVPEDATRVCFGADRRFKYLATTVYETEPKKKKWTAKRGNNLDVDPEGGNSCGDHRSDIRNAKVMIVDVD